MGVMDKFLSYMKLNGDEEYDDYDDDDYYDDDEPVEKISKMTPKAKAEPFMEEDKPKKTSPKVTPMRQPRRTVGNGMEVCVIKPTSIEDAREITETLLANRTVVLNLEGLDVDIAQRISILLQDPASQSAAICRRFPSTYLLSHRPAWTFQVIFRKFSAAP